MSKINVEEIADKIIPALDEQYAKETNAIISGLNFDGKEDATQKAELLHAITIGLRNHLERFTIKVVQEVVDQLESGKNSI